MRQRDGEGGEDLELVCTFWWEVTPMSSSSTIWGGYISVVLDSLSSVVSLISAR